MALPIRSATKELVLGLPFAREKYFQRTFLIRSPSCKGVFASFAEAIAAIPPKKELAYHHEAASEAERNNLDYFNRGDYPIVFWLSRLVPGARLVFELGGNLGLGFFAYRKYVTYPPELRWIICELPAIVEAGRKLAEDRKETQLGFTEQREIDRDPDIYVTFGTLQYIEESFAEVLRKLRVRPPHILITRVPFTTGAPFITLQNNGAWFSPYKVDNISDFIASIEALGYEVVDQWDIERAVSFLLHPEYQTPRYYGAYFRLK
jgi:putative methyltransferase (TIGR04325 family)